MMNINYTHIVINFTTDLVFGSSQWHDQEEWVGCQPYCFWDIGKNSVQIPLFYIVFSTDKFFITL